MSMNPAYSPGPRRRHRRRDGHLHRRGRPALPRLPGRRTGRALHVRRGRLPAAARRAADRQAAGRVPEPRRRRPPAAAAAPRPAQGPAEVDAADGRPAHRRQRPGPLRPGHGRQLAATPTCARPSGCWPRSRSPSPTTSAFSKGLQPVPARQDLPHAANFLYMLRGSEADARRGAGVRRVADPVRRARVQRLDVHRPRRSSRRSPTCTRPSSAAIGALEGAAARRGEREGDGHAAGGRRRRRRPRSGSRDALARKERIMGFGHRVYKTGDVRAGILKTYARKAAETAGDAAVGGDGRGDRAGDGGREEHVPEPRLAGRPAVPRAGAGGAAVHADLRDVAGRRLDAPTSSSSSRTTG